MTNAIGDTGDRRLRLARRFRKQQAFSREGSPLAACLCGLVAERLEAAPGDGVGDWIVEASGNCRSFAVPMLLLAAIHREVLRANPDFKALAAFFPTVGGARPVNAEQIRFELEKCLWAYRETFTDFLQSATVQTNETARGLCWLLPALYLPWPEMALVDLGCSAGLNLVADLRHYCLQGVAGAGQVFEVGAGQSPQFSVTSEDFFEPPGKPVLPRIRARLGCDLHPFAMENAEDELTLASFVWGDQLQRMSRLREGIAALYLAQKSNAPVRLFPADLPEDLPTFLDRRLAGYSSRTPVMVYNTYLTPYLADKGASLGDYLDQWARKQPQPVLWLQWELLHQGPDAPELGWLAWTAQWWSQGQHRKWHLAWVHPHGTRVKWLPDLASWAEFCRLYKRELSATFGAA